MNQTGWNSPVSQFTHVKILLLKMVDGWNPNFFNLEKHRFHILHFPNSTRLFTKPTGRHYTKYRFSPDIVINYNVGLTSTYTHTLTLSKPSSIFLFAIHWMPVERLMMTMVSIQWALFNFLRLASSCTWAGMAATTVVYFRCIEVGGRAKHYWDHQ